MRRLTIAVALILFAAASVSPSPGQTQGAGTPKSADDQAVRQVVTDFGKQLRSVSVLAPPTDVASGMRKAYGPFVTPELLAKWQRAPSNAPGKRTSSPSPERIDIESAAPKGRDEYSVVGKVILLTEQERRNGGVFQANPVRMTLVRRQGQWLISTYQEKEASP